LACVAGFRGEDQAAAIPAEFGAAVRGVNDAQENAIALNILGNGADAYFRGKVGVGFTLRQVGDGSRSPIGFEAVVGIEQLAVCGVGLAVAVEVARGVAV